MKKISTSQLKPGMVVEKAITTKRGQVVATAGTELTGQLIARLSFYKIPLVYVTDESANVSDTTVDTSIEIAEEKEAPTEAPQENAPHQPSQIDTTHSYSQHIRTTPKYHEFQANYSKNIIALQNTFQGIIDGDPATACNELIKNAETLFSSKTSLELFDMIHTMRAVEDSTYAHCLNVALISRAIGKWLHLSKADLDTLTMAGLLHDIGKVKIPKEILNKQGKLTDEEFDLIRSHAKLGHKILSQTNLDTRIKLAALQHHERFDGSGYPRGLESDEIDFFASIVAIADVYDAMTAARAYRAPKCAFQVIAAFEQDGFQKYNPNVIFTFLERVAGCYNNSRVLLSDGRVGRVVFLNKHKLSRPIIETDNGVLMDLSRGENKDITINSIL